MNSFNSNMISIYIGQASQAFSSAINSRMAVQQQQTEWRMLDSREAHVKNMIQLYNQQFHSGNASAMSEIERLNRELNNIYFKRNEVASTMQMSYNQLAYYISDALSKTIEAISLAVQNNDDMSLALVNGTVNSILQFIDQTRSIDFDLYKLVIMKCRNNTNSFSLTQLRFQNKSMLAMNMLMRIQQVLNVNLY